MGVPPGERTTPTRLTLPPGGAKSASWMVGTNRPGEYTIRVELYEFGRDVYLTDAVERQIIVASQGLPRDLPLGSFVLDPSNTLIPREQEGQEDSVDLALTENAIPGSERATLKITGQIKKNL